jgi:hypothetical protein
MALTELQLLRLLLEDNPAPEAEVATSAANETEFMVSNPPIGTGSETVRVDGIEKASPADYDVAASRDRIVFVTAPGVNKKIEVEYTRQTWPDEELDAYLVWAAADWDDNSVEKVRQAGVYAIDTLLVGAATGLNFQAGDISEDLVSVWQRLIQLRQEWSIWLEQRFDRPSLAIVDMVFDVDDPTPDWLNLPADFYWPIYASGGRDW